MQQHLWQLGLTHSALYAQEHKAVLNAQSQAWNSVVGT